MSPVKKNIIAFGLIFLLAIPLFFSVIDLVKQKILQKNSKERFATEMLQTVRIAKQNIIWAKKDKEVIINGKYFDVKSIIINGDDVFLTGFFDHTEDKLVMHFKKLFQQKNESDSPFHSLAVTLIFHFIFTQPDEINITRHWKLISNTFYSYSENLSEVNPILFSPPPEL